MVVACVVMVVMRSMPVPCLRDVRLIIHEMFLLLLKRHQIGVDHHSPRAITGRKTSDERLRIYFRPRGSDDGRRSEQHWWCRCQWVQHFHLIDRHTVLPPHCAVVPPGW